MTRVGLLFNESILAFFSFSNDSSSEKIMDFSIHSYITFPFKIITNDKQDKQQNSSDKSVTYNN